MLYSRRLLATVLLACAVGCGGKGGGGLLADPQVTEIVNHPFWKGPVTADDVEAFVATVQGCKRGDTILMGRTSGRTSVNSRVDLDPSEDDVMFSMAKFATAPDRATILRTFKRRLDEAHHERY